MNKILVVSILILVSAGAAAASINFDHGGELLFNTDTVQSNTNLSMNGNWILDAKMEAIGSYNPRQARLDALREIQNENPEQCEEPLDILCVVEIFEASKDTPLTIIESRVAFNNMDERINATEVITEGYHPISDWSKFRPVMSHPETGTRIEDLKVTGSIDLTGATYDKEEETNTTNHARIKANEISLPPVDGSKMTCNSDHAGDIIFDSEDDVHKGCDGDSWYSMSTNQGQGN